MVAIQRPLIVCGGTGGHLTPGIALAQRFRRRGLSPTIVTSRKSIDARLCRDYDGLEFVAMAGSGFGLRPDRLCRFLCNLCRAFCQSLVLIHRKKADAVIAFGGFTSVPLGLAAKLMGRKLFLHEANQVPGKSTAVLAPMADRVYLPASLKNGRKFVGRKRFRAAGFPLRQDFVPMDRRAARRDLGFPEDGPLLLITGGSQGARVLVDWLDENEGRLRRERISVFCLTGLAGVEGEKDDANLGVRIVRRRFWDRMHVLFSAADLMVARAGAGTIAESIRCHLPTIFIPYPFAAHNHQYHNGKPLVEAGAAQMLEQKDMGRLLERVLATIGDGQLLSTMVDQLVLLDRESGSAAEWIADDILSASCP